MSDCACCGGRGRPWARKECYGAEWHLDRCDGCGFAYVWPRPPAAAISAFYESQGGHGRESSTSLDPVAILAREESFPGSTIDARRMVARIVAILRGTDLPGRRRSLLDVGCGYGFFSREAVSAGLSVSAIEMSQHELSVARSLSGVTPTATAFEAFEPGRTFDAILMSQVLEHALDPVEWVSKAYRLLGSGGVLAIAVPNFDGVFRRVLGVRDFMIIPPAHLNYFGPNSLSTLLQRHGFGAVVVEHVTRIPRDTFQRRLGALPALVRGAELLTRPACGAIDAFKLGGIINVYAVRP